MSRSIILKVLQQHRGEFVSGERICAEIGVTRAAVWKGIERLRREGYEIESKPHQGYCLRYAPDALSAEALRAALDTKVVGSIVRCFEAIDSTNTYAKIAAAEPDNNGLVVIADQQTGGRGRCGRSFESPAGLGLYLSALLKPKANPADVIPVTAMAAVAVCNAVERVCGIRPGIKWTNDIILNGKKLAGILTEMGIEGESGQLQYVVVGIGLNVNHQSGDFTPEIEKMATSLALETGKPVRRLALACALVEELDRVYADIGGDRTPYLAAYRRDCVTLGKEVRIIGSGQERTGVALDIDESFGLRVRTADGTEELVQSGEVSVRGLYGYV